ncbi:hypothetical protein CEXT_328531 [Caerostris extrusa]|uniref:Uncharacterized protein n=1 Tax=Caerostris extrusa TaxID=172846 RepID=A0AAV4NXR1_CAEEX|nr:hypothetical protein CEXT_328531 [Caerostris extrusa]
MLLDILLQGQRSKMTSIFFPGGPKRNITSLSILLTATLSSFPPHTVHLSLACGAAFMLPDSGFRKEKERKRWETCTLGSSLKGTKMGLQGMDTQGSCEMICPVLLFVW